MPQEKELKFNLQLFAESGEEEVVEEVTEEVVEEKKYTDKEVNDIIAKKKAKWEKKNEKPQKEEADKSETESTEAIVEESPYKAMYLQSEVKVAMGQNGIDTKKIGRAVRLIDTTQVVNETGELDEEKLNQAIADLITEWPELKTGHDQEGFQFGADAGSQEKIEDDQLKKAFGLK